MSERRTDYVRENVVCARLMRSLAHLIRGDLSVITNDLLYVGSLVGDNEVARARSRCANVAQTLSKLGALSLEDATGVISAAEFARRFGVEMATECAAARISCDITSLNQIVGALREVFGEWKGALKQGRDNLSLNRELLVELIPLARSITGETFNSCGEYAAAEVGERAVIDGCLVDLMCSRCGWRIEVGRQSGIVMRIPALSDDSRSSDG